MPYIFLFQQIYFLVYISLVMNIDATVKHVETHAVVHHLIHVGVWRLVRV